VFRGDAGFPGQAFGWGPPRGGGGGIGGVAGGFVWPGVSITDWDNIPGGKNWPPAMKPYPNYYVQTTYSIDPEIQPYIDKLKNCVCGSKIYGASCVCAAFSSVNYKHSSTLPANYAALNPYGPFERLIEISDSFLAAAEECSIMEILLHETAHQCGFIMPEWKAILNRIGNFFITSQPHPGDRIPDEYFTPFYPENTIYGYGVNNADTLATDLMSNCCCNGYNYKFRMRDVYLPKKK
jgi:hypothetical protein